MPHKWACAHPSPQHTCDAPRAAPQLAGGLIYMIELVDFILDMTEPRFGGAFVWVHKNKTPGLAGMCAPGVLSTLSDRMVRHVKA
jgi:hypothetical protein